MFKFDLCDLFCDVLSFVNNSLNVIQIDQCSDSCASGEGGYRQSMAFKNYV